jgi:hypothetical protein
MKRLSILVLVAAALAALSTAASAGTVRQERREARQEARIAHGLRSGALTRGEAARLMRGQARIDRMQLRARANDGVIGPRERARIERAQDRQSRAIWRLEHNRRVAV